MKIYYKWLALFVAATFIMSSCSSKHFATSKEPIKAEVLSDETYEELKDPEISNPADEPPVTSLAITDASQSLTISTKPPKGPTELKVHFIDVGQGDSIFVELPNGETMLIDAGESDQADKVVTYIHSQGYDSLEYVVATHAHSDHIGGFPDVLSNFEIDNFYMTSAVATTHIYENMLYAAQNSGADIHNVMAGDIILDISDLLVEVVAPKVIDKDEQNNNSIVIKLTYGDNKFLFTGDAEKSEEDGIWTNIKCDVLKVGHHGSDSSSTSNFLKKVEPSYAVISCGLHNSYGHPDDVIVKRLFDRNISVFRTDQQGTIVFTSDGSEISVNVSPSEYTLPITATTTAQGELENLTVDNGTTYVLNTSTKKIH